MSMSSEPLEEDIINLEKTIKELKDKLADSKETIAKAVEEGCPTFQWLKKPCFACILAAERVRKCLV